MPDAANASTGACTVVRRPSIDLRFECGIVDCVVCVVCLIALSGPAAPANAYPFVVYSPPDFGDALSLLESLDSRSRRHELIREIVDLLCYVVHFSNVSACALDSKTNAKSNHCLGLCDQRQDIEAANVVDRIASSILNVTFNGIND